MLLEIYLCKQRLINLANDLIILPLDIADNRIGADAGEVGDVAVDDRLADDRLAAVLAYICLISWGTIDTAFPFLSLERRRWLSAAFHDDDL